MSKETNTKQTSLLGDSHANHSQLQEREKEQMMTAISGMKLLESSENLKQGGLLAKTLKELLTSKTAWFSDRCVMTWKKKVSKSNVLLFQLQASVRGIKGKESGFLPTPNTMDHIDRKGMRPSRAATNRKSGYLSEMIKMYPTPTQDSANERQNKYKQGGMPLPLAVKMYPTPTASCEMDVVAPPQTVQQNSQGWSVTRLKTGTKFGAKLNDVVNKVHEKPGGKLNPNFVEFLMAYPQDWTKIERTESKVSETQSFHSSQENLDLPSLKQKRMYRTPTAMDVAEDSFVFAAKLLKGKINRSSNSRVQITLSTDIAMEYLKSNPHLIDEYDKPFKIRPNLPNKFEFIFYLKSNTSIKELSTKTDLPKTKIEHWFRKDNCFSYPSIEDWNKIKPYLKEIKFDDELTYKIEEDWKS
jgi:hypothetical protein